MKLSHVTCRVCIVVEGIYCNKDFKNTRKEAKEKYLDTFGHSELLRKAYLKKKICCHVLTVQTLVNLQNIEDIRHF